MRASWDEYFMQLAAAAATRATCDRRRVGVVVARDKCVLATGYNGSIRGLEHCDDVGHLMEDGHCVRTVHAEANALVQAARNGVRVEGATLYTTHLPCWSCFGLLANAGVVRVVFDEAYRADDEGPRRVRAVAAEAGVFVEQFVGTAKSDVEVTQAEALPQADASLSLAAVFHEAWGACVGLPLYNKSVWKGLQRTAEAVCLGGDRLHMLHYIREAVLAQGGVYPDSLKMESGL